MSNQKRYSDEELKEFEALLEEKRMATMQELQELRSQLQELNTTGSSYSDDSSRHEQQTFLQRLITRQEKRLEAQKQALARIENKSYGICMVTGELISKKRLMAMPTAMKSIEAKQREARMQ